MQNIEYPYLPENKEILYVSIENHFMQEAKWAALNLSTDTFHSTGAVVVKDNQIIGKGGNGPWIGKIKFINNLHKKGFCLRKLFKIPSGQKYWLCPGCANYSDHGEQKAIKDALSKTKNIENADLYLYGHWWCCKPCWDKMISVGIKNVYLLDESLELFKK